MNSGVSTSSASSFQDLILDQTIEKVSFCAPDRNFERAFSYICRDGTTRRWICHCFMAIKDSVSSLIFPEVNKENHTNYWFSAYVFLSLALSSSWWHGPVPLYSYPGPLKSSLTNPNLGLLYYCLGCVSHNLYRIFIVSVWLFNIH